MANIVLTADVENASAVSLLFKINCNQFTATARTSHTLAMATAEVPYIKSFDQESFCLFLPAVSLSDVVCMYGDEE